LQLRVNQAEAELAAARARAAAAEAASADLKRQAADTAAKLALLENQAKADQVLSSPHPCSEPSLGISEPCLFLPVLCVRQPHI